VKEFIRVMKAVSDPTRVKMLKVLEERSMCVCELQTALGIAQSTTSKHLKILEDAGLVGSHKDGLWVNYTTGRRSPESICGRFAGQPAPLAERRTGRPQADGID
jgi:ArsR family transcriptional regulator